MSLTLQEDELQKTQKQQEEEAEKAGKIVLPSTEQDKEALHDLLGVLDEWDQDEKEAMGIGRRLGRMARKSPRLV